LRLFSRSVLPSVLWGCGNVNPIKLKKLPKQGA
jgi:hypothetical protein